MLNVIRFCCKTEIFDVHLRGGFAIKQTKKKNIKIKTNRTNKLCLSAKMVNKIKPKIN